MTPPGTPKTLHTQKHKEKCCLNFDVDFLNICSSSLGRLAAGAGPSGGGEASPRSFAEYRSSCLARPATSDRGAADLKASPLPPAPSATS